VDLRSVVQIVVRDAFVRSVEPIKKIVVMDYILVVLFTLGEVALYVYLLVSLIASCF